MTGNSNRSKRLILTCINWTIKNNIVTSRHLLILSFIFILPSPIYSTGRLNTFPFFRYCFPFLLNQRINKQLNQVNKTNKSNGICIHVEQNKITTNVYTTFPNWYFVMWFTKNNERIWVRKIVCKYFGFTIISYDKIYNVTLFY